jgi:hypothetical protein
MNAENGQIIIAARNAARILNEVADKLAKVPLRPAHSGNILTSTLQLQQDAARLTENVEKSQETSPA